MLTADCPYWNGLRDRPLWERLQHVSELLRAMRAETDSEDERECLVAILREVDERVDIFREIGDGS